MESDLLSYRFFIPKIYVILFQTIGLRSLKFTNASAKEYQLHILASKFQILLLRVDDLFVLQELFSRSFFRIREPEERFIFFLELVDVLRKCILCRNVFLTRLSSL